MSNATVDTVDKRTLWYVILASSVGTLIEWYDFYIFGSLAVIIAKQFFPEDGGTAALLSTLAIFAAGFIVRPFGALVFGRLGDLIGRKYTFLLTLVLMGGSTFLIGCIPGYKTIGMAAPLLVLLLRLVQGLALGGEYGGAATYVAEHAPVGKRGYYTSWIQTTATLGLFLSLGVIMSVRKYMGVEQFGDWGWRIPFLVSAILLVVSVFIRLKMAESPMFQRVKASGKGSKNPLKDSFGKRDNFRMVLLALFGAVMGQGVIWYTGQFYAQSFIENTCKIEFNQSREILLYAILMATPGFIIFGWLSDRVGRKWIMMAGMLLGILSYRYMYQDFLDMSDPKQKTETSSTTIKAKTAVNDAKKPNVFYIAHTDSVTYDDGAMIKFVKTDTVKLAAPFVHTSTPGKTDTLLMFMSVTDTTAVKMKSSLKKDEIAGTDTVRVTVASISAKPGIGPEKTVGDSDFWRFVMLVFFQIIFVTMVYGPIAAFLVELFPTRIRYTSMSLPYHIGNGVFGGLVPFLGTLIIEYTKTADKPGGDPLAGLWYPIGIAAVCLVIGTLYLTNKTDEDVSDDVNEYMH